MMLFITALKQRKLLSVHLGRHCVGPIIACGAVFVCVLAFEAEAQMSKDELLEQLKVNFEQQRAALRTITANAHLVNTSFKLLGFVPADSLSYFGNSTMELPDGNTYTEEVHARDHELWIDRVSGNYRINVSTTTRNFGDHKGSRSDKTTQFQDERILLTPDNLFTFDLISRYKDNRGDLWIRPVDRAWTSEIAPYLDSSLLMYNGQLRLYPAHETLSHHFDLERKDPQSIRSRIQSTDEGYIEVHIDFYGELSTGSSMRWSFDPNKAYTINEFIYRGADGAKSTIKMTWGRHGDKIPIYFPESFSRIEDTGQYISYSRQITFSNTAINLDIPPERFTAEDLKMNSDTIVFDRTDPDNPRNYDLVEADFAGLSR